MQIELNKEHVCEWPDGSLRKVMVTAVHDGKANILWNERHGGIPGQGCVVGLDDVVPVEWLYIPNN